MTEAAPPLVISHKSFREDAERLLADGNLSLTEAEFRLARERFFGAPGGSPQTLETVAAKLDWPVDDVIVIDRSVAAKLRLAIESRP
jgi:DNA-directed RNA polymerase sigma subunit (sigma70/sigma32)